MVRAQVRVAALVILAVVLASGCARFETTAPFAQSGGYLYEVKWGRAGVQSSGRYTLDSLSTRAAGRWGLPFTRCFVLGLTAKVHPSLQADLSAPESDTSGLEVVVALRDPHRVPRMPVEAFAAGGGMLSSTAARDSVDSLLTRLERERAGSYTRTERRFRTRFHIQPQGRLLLTQAIVARVPRGQLRALAADAQVASVQPLWNRESLPLPLQAAAPGTIGGASTQMGLAPLVSAGFARGFLRVADSGVDESHPWFSGVAGASSDGTSPSLAASGCVGSPGCGAPGGTDLASLGHGTQVAGILVSSADWPDRGVTDAQVHECVVRYRDPDGVLLHDATAIHSALTAPFAPPPLVALVEVVDNGGPESVIAGSCNGAFEAGICVLAPIGNGGDWQDADANSGSQSPGSARGVLGVGARDAATPERTIVNQSYGHVVDREKPDLQSLTNVRTAAPGGATEDFGATSGAAPFAAAAALCLRTLFHDAAPGVDPGQVYSALLACGSALRAGERFPEKLGAGLLGLPAAGTVWFGSVQLAESGWQEIELPAIPAGASRVRVGLWWMDPAPVDLGFGIGASLHRDFDLELKTAAGQSLVSSRGAFGTFERLDASLPAGATSAGGELRLTITAPRTGSRAATGYWSVFVTP